MVITGGQSSNEVEPSSVIVMLLSVYTHLTYDLSNGVMTLKFQGQLIAKIKIQRKKHTFSLKIIKK